MKYVLVFNYFIFLYDNGQFNDRSLCDVHILLDFSTIYC